MENSIEKSLQCFYEKDVSIAEKMLDTLILSHPEENFEQFRQDCNYYYSKIFNYPLLPPTVLQLDFMRRCQLQCRICKIWSRQATKAEEELTYEELKILFNQAAELGISNCYFSGGEPFMLPYLFDILEYSNKKGIVAEITTNGLLLTKENCRKLIDLPLGHINVSIDGASAQTHDYHRNKPGLFDEVINNVKQLVALKQSQHAKLPVVVMTCVLTNKNFHEMLDYVKLARELGVYVFFQPYVSENDNYYNREMDDEFVIPRDRFVLLSKEIDSVIEYKMSFEDHWFISNTVDSLQNIKEYFSGSLAPAKYCFASFNRIIVQRNHKVNICPSEIGDFSKNTLREIWFSQQAERARRLTYNCSKLCLMGSAYFPGPTTNDIFLITKRYLLYLQKNNFFNRDSINQIKKQLTIYKSRLVEEGLSQELNKLKLIFRYLKNNRGIQPRNIRLKSLGYVSKEDLRLSKVDSLKKIILAKPKNGLFMFENKYLMKYASLCEDSVVREKILYYCSKRKDYPLFPPFNLTLTLNYTCNQRCIMCAIKDCVFDSKYEIRLEEIKRIIDEMVELGIPDLVLTGGEPFLYRDIFEVIDYAKLKGRRVCMISNGFYNDSTVGRIIKSGVDHIQVSLDGSTKEIYESIRGVSGSFEVVINNIKKLIRNCKSVGVTATVVRQNYRDLLNIAHLAKELGCTRLALRPANISNANPLFKDFSQLLFWIPKEEIRVLREVVHELKEYNTKTNYFDFSSGLDSLVDYFEKGYIMSPQTCFIGFTRLIISYNEKDSYEVWMCGGMVGDIRKKSLKDIWYGKEARNLRRKIKNCKRACLFPELHEPDLENIDTLKKAIFKA